MQAIIDVQQKSHVRRAGLVSQRIDEVEASLRMFLENWESKVGEMTAEEQKSAEFLHKEFECRVTSKLEDELREFRIAKSLLENKFDDFEANYAGKIL